MSNIEERFSYALHTTARTWRQALDCRMKDLGISQAGWMTIALIAKSQRPMSQIELANAQGIEGPSMVAMLDRLMKCGLILREPSPTDRRIKLVVLTEAGAALYAKLITKAGVFRKELLIDIDPEKLRIATELLEQLQHLLEHAE
ncbi:MAG TPA: MarR family transcriptional regulator [Herbaspirillum sp.]|jgi:MarR family transcriptional regulator for hemolysin|nr:MarR family transcriptional regulator [Herbaspirillum sp.]